MGNKKEVSQLKMGVILTYASQIIHILSGIIYTPIMLRILGQREYGLYQMVYAVVSYLSLLNMGFGGAYMRLYSKYRKDDDETEIARLNGMFMTIFLIISGICLLCGMGMVAGIRYIYPNGLTEEEISKARILMLIMIYSIMISFPASVYDCILASKEKFIFQKLLLTLQSLLNPFLTLPLLLMGLGSTALVAVTASLVTLKFIASVVYCHKKLHAGFLFHDLQFKLFRETFVFTFYIFINMIVSQLNLNVDRVLLGRFCGTVSVAVYGLASTLNAMFTNMSTAVSAVFEPRINRIEAEGNGDEKLTDLFIRVGRIQFMILALAVGGFIFFGKEFMNFWGGKGYEDSYYIALLLMVPSLVPLIQNTGIEIQRAKNKHKVRSIVYLFIAICNVIISIPLIKIWGGIGAALGTAIALIIGNCIFMNVYYYKALHINVIRFWKSISEFLPSMLIMAIVGILFQRYVLCGKTMVMFLGMAGYALIYIIAIWFGGMNQSEKELVLKAVRVLTGGNK